MAADLHRAVGMRTLREVVRAGVPTIGTFINLGSPLATEACALADFDWLLIDLEHGGGGEDALVSQLLAAAAHDVPAIVRVESPARIRTGRALDLGAAGIMFPRIESADEGVEAVRCLRYPPAGTRGVATYNRARQFGKRSAPFVDDDERHLGIVQIESVSALDEIERIAAIPGIDVLFVGPADLSHALGVPGRVDDRLFRAALGRVLTAAARHHVAAGILARSVEQASGYFDEGFTFIAVASDAAFLVSTARDAAASLSRRLRGAGSTPDKEEPAHAAQDLSA